MAVNAADAYFRLTGKPGFVTTTVGPGLTNTLTGLGDALLDSSAVVVIAAGVPMDLMGYGQLQELGIHEEDGQFGLVQNLTKRAIRVWDVNFIDRKLNESVKSALNGCPGPVVLHVPLEHFSKSVDSAFVPTSPGARAKPRPGKSEVETAAAVVFSSERPLILLGNGALLSEASQSVCDFVEEFEIPVVTTMSGQGAFPKKHPLSLGLVGVVGERPANTAIRESDCVIAIGTRFPEMDSSSWQPDQFIDLARTKLVQIDIDPDQLDRIFSPTSQMVGDAKAAIEDLLEYSRSRSNLSATNGENRKAWVLKLQNNVREWEYELEPIRSSDIVPFEPAFLLTWLRNELPEDTVIVTGVGVRHLVGQHFPLTLPRTQIVGSGFGTMGQEIGAVIGAKVACPNQPVIGLVGDGSFLASLPAVPTATLNKIPCTWLVLNNDGYASISVYQNKHYGRREGTLFSDSNSEVRFDYAAFAESMGAVGVRVNNLEELQVALTESQITKVPMVIDVPVVSNARTLASGNWRVNSILARASSAKDDAGVGARH